MDIPSFILFYNQILPSLKVYPSQFALGFFFFPKVQTGDFKRLPPEICLETQHEKDLNVTMEHEALIFYDKHTFTQELDSTEKVKSETTSYDNITSVVRYYM